MCGIVCRFAILCCLLSFSSCVFVGVSESVRMLVAFQLLCCGHAVLSMAPLVVSIILVVGKCCCPVRHAKATGTLQLRPLCRSTAAWERCKAPARPGQAGLKERTGQINICGATCIPQGVSLLFVRLCECVRFTRLSHGASLVWQKGHRC